jgi:glucose/arabinose dehydrogenase
MASDLGAPEGDMRRILIVIALVVVAGVGACRYLVPERFAVNAPIVHQMFGGEGAGAPEQDVVEARMRVPRGFVVGLWATEVRGARGLRFTPSGDLLVTRPRAGQIVLLEADRDGDGRSDGRRVLMKGLNRPHGMDFHEDWLYVAETDGFGRVRYSPGDGSEADPGRLAGAYERLVEDLPEGGNHWTRTIRIGPDQKVYVTIGSSCNVCLEDDPSRRAAMLRFELDGSGETTFATGLRNTVGFDWRPSTGEIYGTDNGRDLLGDDFPPCELNHIVEGGFYGWPYANGAKVPDPDFGEGNAARIESSIPPVHAFRAHNAPLGMAFVRGLGALTASGDVAIVALHGSWNRRDKDGYEVVSLHFTPEGQIIERDFLTGFLEREDVIGRPVDVTQGPDGAVYVSDDYANVIWRVSLAGQGPASPGLGAGAGRGVTDPLVGLDAETLERLDAQGEALYASHECGSCHEPALAGEGVVVKPLEELGLRYSLAELGSLLQTPPSPMPIPDLDAEQRRALAVHLLSR